MSDHLLRHNRTWRGLLGSCVLITLMAVLLLLLLLFFQMFMAKEKLGDIVVFIKRRFAHYQASQAPKNNNDATNTTKPITSSESDPTKLIK